jgi:hypothetical protein
MPPRMPVNDASLLFTHSPSLDLRTCSHHARTCTCTPCAPRLSVSDIVHHLVFVSVLCGLGIAFKDKGGVANNFGCFFLSGLPGGLDYVLLVLMNEGVITKLQEKRANRFLQQWLRAPSMSIYAFLAFTAWRTLCPRIAFVCVRVRVRE